MYKFNTLYVPKTGQCPFWKAFKLIMHAEWISRTEKLNWCGRTIKWGSFILFWGLGLEDEALFILITQQMAQFVAMSGHCYTSIHKYAVIHCTQKNTCHCNPRFYTSQWEEIQAHYDQNPHEQPFNTHTWVFYLCEPSRNNHSMLDALWQMWQPHLNSQQYQCLHVHVCVCVFFFFVTCKSYENGTNSVLNGTLI